ncbi:MULTISPECIES: PKD domain-containing protein [Chitinophagaceae]
MESFKDQLRSSCKIIVVLLCGVLFSTQSFGHHIKGGWIGYQYTTSTSTTTTYQVTVYLYVSCTTTGPTDKVVLGVFDGASNSTILTQSINNTTHYNLTKGTFSPCMTNPPSICYNIYTYQTTITLNNNTAGYVLAVQDAYRIDNIANIANSGSTGITITGTIPGTINGTSYAKNNSPQFIFQDTAIVCHNATISLPFTAVDQDGDSLSYSFTNGLNVTNANQNTANSTPSAPPYPSLTYLSGYNGSQPLGNNVTINPVTGLISGTAPATTGEYVIAVYVKEWRNGVLIDSLKKELQILVNDCSLSAATLNPSYINCQDYELTFSNNSSTNISSYLWNFGDTKSTDNTSSAAAPTHTYSDTGTYTLKLSVKNNAGCQDSTTATVKVYPGFRAGFYTLGTCYQSPISFFDTSYCKYGNIILWSWNFGDASTSPVQNPTHQYSTPSNYTTALIIQSSKGCSDTATQTVIVNGKPDLKLPFTDTLICSIDSLQLHAISSSAKTYKWSPLSSTIIHPETADPTVFPKDTTIYTVVVTDQGCVDSATVTVNVLDFIDVKISDTIACRGDSLTLHPTSQALSFAWTKTAGSDTLNNSNIKNPALLATNDDSYHIEANLGKCTANTDITIRTANYPTVSVYQDTTICYGSSATLTGTTDATNYIWSTGNNSSLTQTVTPTSTTPYTLYVTSPNSYCPKTVSNTATVRVEQPFTVSLGNDTTIVYSQPLVLHAALNTSDSAFTYSWTPNTYLSNDDSAYVTAIIPKGITIQYYNVTATSPFGCKTSDQIRLNIFQTAPDIFVPTGFTPNQDGKNDIVRPILAGIKEFQFFQIFNRWGQLVFATQREGEGWNGLFHGQPQQGGSTFVYHVRGTDYLGNIIDKTGTIVLIR